MASPLIERKKKRRSDTPLATSDSALHNNVQLMSTSPSSSGSWSRIRKAGANEENYQTVRKKDRLTGQNIVLLNQYQLGERIGKGAFGVVYKAYHIETGKQVAVKQLKKDGLDDVMIEAFSREIELLRGLNHVNIVQYIGLLESENHMNIILEYVESGSLAKLCKTCGVFPEDITVRYVEQVLRGLDYVHSRGIVHRDIKASNILITKEGVVKLADFGIATTLSDLSSTGTADVLGKKSPRGKAGGLRGGGLSTSASASAAFSSVPSHSGKPAWNPIEGSPFWMAPEVIELQPPTPACDIWSLGCTVIELLTGYPPYHDMPAMSALFKMVQSEHPPFPDDLSPEAADFLEKCFERDPAKRPSAAALMQHPWVARVSTLPTLPLKEAKKTVKGYNTAERGRLLDIDWARWNADAGDAAAGYPGGAGDNVDMASGDAANENAGGNNPSPKALPIRPKEKTLKERALAAAEHKHQQQPGTIDNKTNHTTAPAQAPNPKPASNNSDELSITILGSEPRKNRLFTYTVYKLQVQQGSNNWIVFRSYNEFKDLHQKCKKALRKSKQKFPKLPPSKFFGASSTQFVNERRMALELYINAALKHKQLLQHDFVLEFLQKVQTHGSSAAISVVDESDSHSNQDE